MTPSILLVVDDSALTAALQEALEPMGRVETAANGEEALEKLHRQPFRLLLTERMLPGIDGLALARKAKDQVPDLRVALLAPHLGPEWEHKAKGLGVEWIPSSPLSASRLRESLSRLLAPAAAPVPPLRVEDGARPTALIGVSEPMQEVFRLVEKARLSRAPVLVQGESGTGKELVARAIAQGGPSEGKLVVVNCCALSDTLIESELFGHARGSFSGALGDREGLFETAHQGTLFLDEIGDLPLRSQAKLLRVLQEGELRRVGENRLRHVQVRILAATNRPLLEAVESRQFREDLYYRLNVIPVYLPPLRERPSDIPALAAHFLQKHRRKGQPAPALSDAAMGRLLRYPFPGNVRELENIVQRAIASARGTVLTEKEIEACLQPPNSAAAPEPVFAGRSYPDLKAHLRRLEKDFLDQVLRAHAYRVAEAAKALGVARTALHNRIKALGIHVHR